MHTSGRFLLRHVYHFVHFQLSGNDYRHLFRRPEQFWEFRYIQSRSIARSKYNYHHVYSYYHIYYDFRIYNDPNVCVNGNHRNDHHGHCNYHRDQLDYRHAPSVDVDHYDYGDRPSFDDNGYALPFNVDHHQDRNWADVNRDDDQRGHGDDICCANMGLRGYGCPPDCRTGNRIRRQEGAGTEALKRRGGVDFGEIGKRIGTTIVVMNAIYDVAKQLPAA
jgi:hypothetical protein